MSFVNFLKSVAKIAFGFIGGFILLFAGIMTAAQGEQGIGYVAAFVGIILILYGVYNEREL